jgi:signal peptidase I
MNHRSLQQLRAAVLIIMLLLTSCGGPKRSRVVLHGGSMEPNFKDGDVLVFAETPPTDLKRGDVIMFESGGTGLIKRIVGLPNETIAIQDGQILIDGNPLQEPYEVIPFTATLEPVELDSQSYYVLGDNRPESKDSRDFGPVQAAAIKGRAEIK